MGRMGYGIGILDVCVVVVVVVVVVVGGGGVVYKIEEMLLLSGLMKKRIPKTEIQGHIYTPVTTPSQTQSHPPSQPAISSRSPDLKIPSWSAAEPY